MIQNSAYYTSTKTNFAVYRSNGVVTSTVQSDVFLPAFGTVSHCLQKQQVAAIRWPAKMVA